MIITFPWAYCLIQFKIVSFLIVNDVSRLRNASISLKSLAENIITKERIKLLGEGNLFFCEIGSWENYFGAVGRQNNNNNNNNKPKFPGRLIKK